MQKNFHINFSYVDDAIYYKDTMLVQLGRLYCAPLDNIEKHAHVNWYELTVVTDGEGTIYTNDVATDVKKGDIYLSHPGDFHEIQSSEDKPLKFDFFAFNSRNSEVSREFKRIVANMFSYDQRVFTNSQITSAVSTAIAEFSGKLHYSTQILSCIFEQILYLIIRNYNVPEDMEFEKRSRPTDELCLQIMHYIDTHIYAISSLSCLSEKFSYNYSYLSNVFKKSTGMTILSYFQTRRLDAAKLLLNENKLKVNQVAEMLKYSSLYSFSKAFKNKYGISPKHYAIQMATKQKSQ